MTDDQTYDLERDRAKATGRADDLLKAELLAIARLMKKQGRQAARDTIHRTIARLEGPEWDGMA